MKKSKRKSATKRARHAASGRAGGPTAKRLKHVADGGLAQERRDRRSLDRQAERGQKEAQGRITATRAADTRLLGARETAHFDLGRLASSTTNFFEAAIEALPCGDLEKIFFRPLF
jgi:hypothetical protein